ncbi:MAG: AAA family ATPase [Desulfatiglandales bacterium]
MYYEFFGLSHPPFKITPDTDMFFEGGNRGAILDALIYAISEGEGIVKVTGEVGSGKTMLCRMLQMRLPSKVETVYIANPSVSPEEILYAIAFELHLPITRASGRIEVMQALNTYLLTRHSQGKQVVVFVEESQGMPLATIEEIRLLSNLEGKRHKLLQIVMFGQPELDDNLMKPQIRQLRERITQSFRLTPLSGKQVADYLAFRLRASGYRGPDLFKGRVVKYILQVTKGLTRRINIVADKTMLSAFADGSHNISLKHVKAAVRDSEFFSSGMRRRPVAQFVYALGGLAVGLGLGLPIFFGLVLLPPAAGFHKKAFEPSTPSSLPAPSFAAMSSAAYAPTASQAAKTNRETHQSLGESNALHLVERRLTATQEWLRETGDTRYVIQMLISREEEHLLANAVRNIQRHFEMENIYVYRTFVKKRPYLAFLYGSFEALAEAEVEIERLPPDLKANRPYCRTIRGVLTEIDSQNSLAALEEKVLLPQ